MLHWYTSTACIARAVRRPPSCTLQLRQYHTGRTLIPQPGQGNMHPSLSHVTGDVVQPLIEKSIGAFFIEQAIVNREREFLVDRQLGIRRSWSEFTSECQAVACALLRRGFQRGDRVGVWLPNCHEWVVTQFACHLAGLLLVNINPAYRSSELKHALNLVGCKGIVVVPRLRSSDYAALLAEARSDGGVPSLQHVFAVERDGTQFIGATASFSELLATPAEAELRALSCLTASINADEAANIQFTSGTTGAPKAATLTHRGILNNGRFVGAALRYGPLDRVCVPVPLYHCFGCVLGTLACVAHASVLVIPSASFDARASLAAVADERCTSLYGVPTMFVAMLEAAADFKLGAQLRTGIMAGSPCPPDVMASVMERLGMREVSICYGMTETSPVSFQTMDGTPPKLRCETVGTIQPHVECKVVDAAGKTVHRGEAGELCTRGYSLFSGYFAQPQATAECVDESGWLHTGDLATIDTHGYCRIIGRKKDMIIRGGENVYPTEVEHFLRRHADITDVAVIGAPHVRLGEEVVAFVIVKAGVEQSGLGDRIRAWAHGKLAHYKVPSRFFAVDEFPLTVSGKVQKFELRRRLGCEPSQ